MTDRLRIPRILIKIRELWNQAHKHTFAEFLNAFLGTNVEMTDEEFEKLLTDQLNTNRLGGVKKDVKVDEEK